MNDISPSLEVRRADQRGQADHGWLRSRFSFSFADYYDPNHMGFRTLRVINDDIIAAGKGFGMHPHRDMEIISYVVRGALEHKDSMGNGSVVRPGDVQRMSAGNGILHSEFNPLDDVATRLLQIWIEPDETGIAPSYEQTWIGEDQKRNRLALIASPDGRDRSVLIHQDAYIFASELDPQRSVVLDAVADRHLWVQIVDGEVDINGTAAQTGDGVALSGVSTLTITAAAPSEFLLFSLS